MDRDTDTTVKPITLFSAFKHSILATQRHAQVLGHFVLYCVRTYTDFCVGVIVTVS